jgi:hypothetical protein
MLRALACLPVLALIAAFQPPPASSVQAPPVVEEADPIEPFIVMIGAERWGVLIDKAMTAVRERPLSDRREPDAAELYRADRATKDGAAALLMLRNEICGTGLLDEAQCQLTDWPAWTSEPPTASTPIAVIQQRSDWLGLTMQPFVDAGCDLGRRTSGDRQYCDVE